MEKKYRVVNASLFTEDMVNSNKFTWMTSNGLEKAEYGLHVEEIDEKC